MQIRRDDRWLATIETVDHLGYVDDSVGAAEASFEVRYRDDGQRIDTTCMRQEPALPWCGSFVDDGRAEITVFWRNNEEPRVLHLRRNEKWAATATMADVVTFEDSPGDDPATYAIRFRLDGIRYEVACDQFGVPLD